MKLHIDQCPPINGRALPTIPSRAIGFDYGLRLVLRLDGDGCDRDPVVSAKPPDLVSLELLCLTVRYASVSRAAAEYGISQPSATVRLRRLERDLGVRLLERSSAGSHPTPDGRLVAEWSETLLSAARELVGAAESLRSRAGPALRIAASYTIAEYLIPGWLARFPDQPERVSIEMEVVNSTGVLARIREGRADLGFIESPVSIGGLASCLVGDDELVCVVGRDHPWARRRTPVSASTLASTPLILRERGSGTRESFVAALARAGFAEPATSMDLGSTAAVKTAVVSGAGVSVLSRLAIVDDERLRIVPVTGLDLARRLRAIWLPGKASNDATTPARQLLGVIGVR